MRLNLEIRRQGMLIALACGAAILIGGTATAFASPAPQRHSVPDLTTTTVKVPSSTPFTDTGIALTKGAVFSITASGTASYDGGAHFVSPYGTSFSGNNGRTNLCLSQQYTTTGWTAPGVRCWSLIGKIGASGVIIRIGKHFTATSPVAGELFLGFNDNFYGDNVGSFSASITTP